MPVDKTMADAILDTYRNMYREISEKGVESDSFKAMGNALRRMEDLALETNDIADFTAKLTTENLFIEFSNAYSETMAALMRGEYSGDDGDEILLEKTLEAYENSIQNRFEALNKLNLMQKDRVCSIVDYLFSII